MLESVLRLAFCNPFTLGTDRVGEAGLWVTPLSRQPARWAAGLGGEESVFHDDGMVATLNGLIIHGQPNLWTGDRVAVYFRPGTRRAEFIRAKTMASPVVSTSRLTKLCSTTRSALCRIEHDIRRSANLLGHIDPSAEA